MPLSEEEQRILHEIERSYYEHDPAFTVRVRPRNSAPPGGSPRRRRLRGLAGGTSRPIRLELPRRRAAFLGMVATGAILIDNARRIGGARLAPRRARSTLSSVTRAAASVTACVAATTPSCAGSAAGGGRGPSPQSLPVRQRAQRGGRHDLGIGAHALHVVFAQARRGVDRDGRGVGDASSCGRVSPTRPAAALATCAGVSASRRTLTGRRERVTGLCPREPDLGFGSDRRPPPGAPPERDRRRHGTGIGGDCGDERDADQDQRAHGPSSSVSAVGVGQP